MSSWGPLPLSPPLPSIQWVQAGAGAMCMCADMLSMAIVWKHVRTTMGLLLTAAYVNRCRRVDLLWPKSDSAQIDLYTNTLIGPQC